MPGIVDTAAGAAMGVVPGPCAWLTAAIAAMNTERISARRRSRGSAEISVAGATSGVGGGEWRNRVAGRILSVTVRRLADRIDGPGNDCVDAGLSEFRARAARVSMDAVGDREFRTGLKALGAHETRID